MRRLVYFVLGFAGTCVLRVYVQDIRFFLAAIAVLLLLGTAAGKDGRAVFRAAWILLGCGSALWYYSHFTGSYLDAVKVLDGSERKVFVRVMDFAEETQYGSVLEGKLTLDGKPYQVRVYLNEKTPAAPGDILHGSFCFRSTTPSGMMESSYYQGKGIFLLAYQTDTVSLTEGESSLQDIPAFLRKRIKQTLAICFPEDTAAFAKALLIGDTSDLDYETDMDFKVSGIRHVVAVSGLHVSILFALLSMAAFRKRWLMALLGFPLLLLFAAVAGFSPSVSRACLMSALILLAGLTQREYDGPTALAFAVLVILLCNPLAVTSVSFQLSVASVAGIYLFAEGIRKWIMGLFGELKGRRGKAFLVHWLAGSISITLSAMTLTTPLCAWYFGMVSLIGPLTNLLALWVVSFIFYGILGVCLLFPVLPAAAAGLARLIAIPIRYVLLVAKTMADVPLAAVYTQSPYIVAWLVFVYVMLFLFLLSSNRRPVLLGCCAALGLCLSLLAGWLEPLRSDASFTVLDVGQGQCLLLQTEGKNIMVDCGGDTDALAADAAASQLLSQGISRLDALIVTHLDRDHAGAVPGLLSRIETDLLILPAQYSSLGSLTSSRVIYASEDVQLQAGSAKVQIYAPTFPGNSNEMSLCLLLDTEKCDILVTGDRNGFGERALLRNADIPDVDILVAGHHGSKNATCEELLSAVKPEIVCISAGKDNSYGHPSPELLRRLSDFGCAIYRTDQMGTITIRR